MTHTQATIEARRIVGDRATVRREHIRGARRKFGRSAPVVLIFTKSGNLVGQGKTYQQALDAAAQWRDHLDTDRLIRENERREELDA